MADVDARLGRLRYASGPTEVMDFLLPLWAAADIGATPAAIGSVVAIEAGASLAVRPVAGVLADRADRQVVAAIGAALYAAAFVSYAVAPGIVVVGLGAEVGGAAPCSGSRCGPTSARDWSRIQRPTRGCSRVSRPARSQPS
jgi:MFS family permease